VREETDMKVISQSHVKRGLIVVAIALCGAGVIGAASIPGTWPPPMPPSGCSSYCYNVDITNNTLNAANDLHVTLWGPTEICSHYLGSLNQFGTPGMNTYSNRIELHYASSTNWVQPGEIAHIGFCTNSPVTGMVTGHTNAGLPPFYWTRQRMFIGDVIAVGHAWHAVRADVGITPAVSVINTTPKDIRIRQVDWAVATEAIALDDLMWTGLENALEWQPLLQGGILPRGTEESPGFLRAEIPLVFQQGDPRHLVFRVWAEDPQDPQNMNRGLGQASLKALGAQAVPAK
jgi:hypothetical protein